MSRAGLALKLEKRGLSRAEIAAELGIAQKHVGSYLRYAKGAPARAAAKRVTSPKGCKPKKSDPKRVGVCPKPRCGLTLFDDGRPHICAGDETVPEAFTRCAP